MNTLAWQPSTGAPSGPYGIKIEDAKTAEAGMIDMADIAHAGAQLLFPEGNSTPARGRSRSWA